MPVTVKVRTPAQSGVRHAHPARGGRSADSHDPGSDEASVGPLPKLGAEIASCWALLTLFVVAAGLRSLIHPAISAWPVSFVCLAPWIVGVGLSRYPGRVYAFTFVSTSAFYLLNMSWLKQAAGPWYAALAIYMTLFEVLAACPLRHLMRRRTVPLAIVFPVLWTGLEFLRAILFSGFPWFMLAHSQYRVLTLIQTADLVGAYGATFVTAAVNGAVADLVLARLGRESATARPIRARLARIGAMFAGALLLFSIVYGQIRIRTSRLSEGPLVATIQGDYLNVVTGDEASARQKFARYRELMSAAAAHRADLYLLPESTWGMILSPTHPRPSDYEYVEEFSRRTGGVVVMGAATVEFRPYDLIAPERVYNSAYVFHPDGGEPGRYDKRHLVYFGEIVPFRFGRLRPVYFWLNALVPFSGPNNVEFSTFPGESFRTFTMEAASQDGRTWRFGIPICYEDVMPYISREFAADSDRRKRVDFLLNISNDGWFGRGTQQEQHLSTCVFRAVENRLGIVRSVNTGVSCFIDPTGRIHDRVNPEGPPPGADNSGFSVARVMTDDRLTWYSVHGDDFGWACLLAAAVFCLDYIFARARGRGLSVAQEKTT